LAAWRRFALASTGLAASAIFLAKAESRNTMRQVRSLAYKKETDDRIDLDRRSSHKKSDFGSFDSYQGRRFFHVES
jgi:hypothetical protein